MISKFHWIGRRLKRRGASLPAAVQNSGVSHRLWTAPAAAVALVRFGAPRKRSGDGALGEREQAFFGHGGLKRLTEIHYWRFRFFLRSLGWRWKSGVALCFPPQSKK